LIVTTAIQPDEFVNRISYAPESVRNGRVMPEAVSLTDLSSRGFSLDRDFVPHGVIEERLNDQMGRQPTKREQAVISRFQAQSVTELVGALPDKPDDPDPAEPEQLFDLVASPVEADETVIPPVLENKAHCHVISRRVRSNSILRKMRHDFLLPILQALITVDKFYSLTGGKVSAESQVVEE
jgi:hypothetical protein